MLAISALQKFVSKNLFLLQSLAFSIPIKAETSLKICLLGDAAAPELIADAVFSGHLEARNFQANPHDIEAALYRREITSLEQ